MILWGDMREFPLFSVLQFLAGQRRTGILEIKDFEDVGAIYFRHGQIEAISSAVWDEMLASWLLSQGALTENDVKECWMKSTQTDDSQPLLAHLLDAARMDYISLMEIVNRHTAELVMYLMYWSAGNFRFLLPPKPVTFKVTPSLDVEGLLLEAFRRYEDGERPWRDKVSTDAEPCLICTLECSEEIRERYLKPDICLWRSMPTVLKDPVSRSIKKRQPVEDEVDMDDLPFI
jgi:hypothetical protein